MLSLWTTDREAVSEAVEALKGGFRDNDLAGYLNNGHFVVVLPETPREGAAVVVARLGRQFGERLLVGAVSFPEDGESFEALLAQANAHAGAPRHGETDAA
jgi:hypothetical protein